MSLISILLHIRLEYDYLQYGRTKSLNFCFVHHQSHDLLHLPVNNE